MNIDSTQPAALSRVNIQKNFCQSHGVSSMQQVRETGLIATEGGGLRQFFATTNKPQRENGNEPQGTPGAQKEEKTGF
jgi:hypothetical protein